MMRNVLVTGGAGFIGSNFIRHLLKVEPALKIINLDALTYAGSLENIKDLPDPGRHLFVQGDICDHDQVEKLLQQHQVDTIVHFAAETHVDRSIKDPGAFIQTNVQGTLSLLEAARKVGLQHTPGPGRSLRFHHISTDEVYGSLSPIEPPFSEESPYAPRSPYSASKAASDHLVRAYFHTYALPVTISNCSNNYGPYQFPEKLIPLTVLNALHGRSLPVYGDGMQIRDWLFVEDHCQAIYRILEHGKPGETYNIGGNNQPTNMEIVQSICLLLDELQPGTQPYAELIKHVADRPGHDRRYAMNIDKIRSTLDWQPQHDLVSGLRTTIRWYLENPQWLQAIENQPGYKQWLGKNYPEIGEN